MVLLLLLLLLPLSCNTTPVVVGETVILILTPLFTYRSETSLAAAAWLRRAGQYYLKILLVE
jgi:hypothetical protein